MSRQPRADQSDSFGSDSFLDIVSNIVGILIILVMVVGVRVRSVADVEEVEVEEPPAAPEFDLAGAQTAVARLEESLSQADATLASAEVELDQKARRRDMLAGSVSATRDEIEREGRQADSRRRLTAESAKELEEKRHAYEAMLFEAEKLSEIKPKAVRLESYQTPFSRTVTGDEVYFRLKGGRIAYVPIKELAERVKEDFRTKLEAMRTTPQLTNVVGPLNGFHCQYTAVRIDLGSSNSMLDQVVAQLQNATFIAESDMLGESTGESLGTSSRFRSIVSRLDPTTTTVTFWTYPDSFADYREVKRELYQLGFSVAARPLPFGHPIGVSSSGTRSSAQ